MASMARTKWLFKAIDSVLPTSMGMEDVSDDEKTPDCSDVCEWFIHILGEKYPDTFSRAAQKLGVPVASKKLLSEELTAMADEGNFGWAMEHAVIQQFLAKKGIDNLPSDRKMHMLGDNAVPPVTKKIKLNEVEYVMSHHALDLVVASELSRVTNAHLKLCDIVLGRDHGQGTFRFPVKLIYKYNNHHLPVEVEKWLGKVVCKKEMYKLFEKMMAEPIQQSLSMMYESKVVAMETDYDGRLLVQCKM